MIEVVLNFTGQLPNLKASENAKFVHLGKGGANITNFLENRSKGDIGGTRINQTGIDQ